MILKIGITNVQIHIYIYIDNMYDCQLQGGGGRPPKSSKHAISTSGAGGPVVFRAHQARVHAEHLQDLQAPGTSGSTLGFRTKFTLKGFMVYIPHWDFIAQYGIFKVYELMGFPNGSV